MMLLFLFLLYSCLGASSIGSDDRLLYSVYRVHGASDANVNGVYICRDDGLGKCYSAKDHPSTHVLYQTYSTANGNVQKRWYIAEVMKNAGGKSINPRNLFGVIEIAKSSQEAFVFDLPWKNLLNRSLVEASMEVKEVSLTCDVNHNDSKTNTSQQTSLYTEVLLLLLEMPPGSGNISVEVMRDCANRLIAITNTDVDDYEEVVLCLWILYSVSWVHAKVCFGRILRAPKMNNAFEGEAGSQIVDSLFECASSSDYLFQRNCAVRHAILLRVVLEFVNTFDVESAYNETARILDTTGGFAPVASNGLIILRGIHAIAAKLLGKINELDSSTNSDVNEACIFLKKFDSFSEYAVKDILTNVCYLLRGNFDYDGSSWDGSVSLAMALLGIGEIEVASRHMQAAIITQSGSTGIGLHDDDAVIIMTILRNHNFFNRSISNRTVAKLLESPNIRSSLILQKLLPHAILLKSNAFSVVLGSLFQTTAPTILFSTPDYWFLEAGVLRIIVISVLETLLQTDLEHSGSKERDFVLMDPNAYFGAPCRGLFLLAYQGVSCRQAFGCPRLFLDYYLPSLYYKLVQRTNPMWFWEQEAGVNRSSAIRDENNDIVKVGFLSSFFFRHSVGRLMAQLIIDLNRKKDIFDIYLITFKTTTSRYKDDITLAFEREILPEKIIVLPSDVGHAGIIIKDICLEILVFGDIFMDSVTAHVAMMRLAKYQVAFWGHPYSSGYPSVDFFISSENYEPIEDRTYHTERMAAFSEQIVMFETLSFSMFPPAETDSERERYDIGPKITQRKEYLSWIFTAGRDLNSSIYNTSTLLISAAKFSGTITTENELHSFVNIYGCQQSIMKMHPLFDLAILNILQSDPLAVILLSRNRKQLGWHKSFVDRLHRSAFQQNATDLLARLILIDQAPHHIYEAIVCGADVTLDPFPFGGGVTLSDSLSCGLKMLVSGEINADNYRPVPFVTSSRLQTVHALGHGFARMINNTMFAMTDNTFDDDLQSMKTYVQNAIDLASTGMKRRNNYDSSMFKDVTKSLYNRKGVSDEWMKFLTNLVRK